MKKSNKGEGKKNKKKQKIYKNFVVNFSDENHFTIDSWNFPTTHSQSHQQRQSQADYKSVMNEKWKSFSLFKQRRKNLVVG